MRSRRLAIVAVLVAVLGVVVGVATRPGAESVVPIFSQLGEPTTPYVPLTERVSSTYFCAGVPATGEGQGGEVVIANPTEETITGELSAFGTSGPLGVQPLSVAPRTTSRVDLGALAGGDYVGAIVEVAGAGAVVQQRAVLGGISSLAPCGNGASTSWNLAEGSTLDGVQYDLVLTNPFPDAAVVDLTFVTATEVRPPTEFQNFVIPARSVRVIDADQVARDEEQLSIAVTSRRGRIVAARSQRYGGSGLTGSSLSLGAPGSERQWLFADGEIGEGISDRFSIMNPGDVAVPVDITLFPADPAAGSLAPFTTEVAAGRSLVVDPSTFGLGVTGRYAASIATAGSNTIVVERRTTRPQSGTAVVTGARFGSGRWWAADGVSVPADGALVVFNASGLEGSFTVSALGPGGVKALPGLENVALAAAGVALVDLPAGAVGVPVLVASETLTLVTEQRYPGGDGARTLSLALPE